MAYFDYQYLSISVIRIKLNKLIQLHIHCDNGKVNLTYTKIVVLIYYNNVDYTELML